MKQLFPEISHELRCLEPVQCCCETMVLRGVEEATSVSYRAVVGTNHWSWHGSNIACKQFPFSALKSYQQLLRGMGAVTAGGLRLIKCSVSSPITQGHTASTLL